MKKILFAAFALCTVAFGACSKDDGGKGDPAGSALLNMMNESNGRTLLGSSDVYVDDAGNFVCSSSVIAYAGRVGGLNGVTMRFDNLVRSTAVDVGGGYLVYDGESLHEFPSGHIALAAGTTYYRMRVQSIITGENAAGKQGAGKIIRRTCSIEHSLQGRHPIQLSVSKPHHSPCGKNNFNIGEFSVFDILRFINSRQKVGHGCNFPNLRRGVDIINLCGIRCENRSLVFFHLIYFSRR